MNPHGLNDHRHLKPARLPIPPLLHFLCASCSLARLLVYNGLSKKSTTFLNFFFSGDILVLALRLQTEYLSKQIETKNESDTLKQSNSNSYSPLIQKRSIQMDEPLNMRKMGLEPTRCNHHKILSLARLPIPTLPQAKNIISICTGIVKYFFTL